MRTGLPLRARRGGHMLSEQKDNGSHSATHCAPYSSFLTWEPVRPRSHRPQFSRSESQEENSMRIATAALLLIIASTLVACVHETTVFHSFNGADYFRGDPVAPPDGSATSQSSAVEPVPSR